MGQKLVRNAAKCLNCNDVIESKHVHDFVSCSCGDIFIDGGLEYTRGGAKDFSKFLSLSETVECNSHRIYTDYITGEKSCGICGDELLDG